MAEKNTQTLEISYGSIIRVIIVLAVIAFLYLIIDIVAILFFSILLILILQPPVSWLKMYKVPRPLGVLIIYLVLLGVLSTAFIIAIPPITQQIGQISEIVGRNYGEIINYLNANGWTAHLGELEQTFGNIQSYFPQATQNLFSRVTGAVGSIVALFIVLVITFYGLVEESAFKRVIRTIVPSQYVPYLYQVSNRLQRKLGQWVRGQILLGLAVFALTYLGLTLLGIEYALTLAIITGILEFIPYVGPIISGLVAVFLTVFISPIQGLFVVILYVVIQQIENHILVPKIMQRATGLNPIVSIIALLIGGKLGGIIGLILAIPVAVALSVFIQDFISSKSGHEMELEG